MCRLLHRVNFAVIFEFEKVRIQSKTTFRNELESTIRFMNYLQFLKYKFNDYFFAYFSVHNSFVSPTKHHSSFLFFLSELVFSIFVFILFVFFSLHFMSRLFSTSDFPENADRVSDFLKRFTPLAAFTRELNSFRSLFTSLKI